MKAFRYLALLSIFAIFLIPAATPAHAQVAVGVGVGAPYPYAYEPYAYGPPVCE